MTVMAVQEKFPISQCYKFSCHEYSDKKLENILKM